MSENVITEPELFSIASEIKSDAEREAYLIQACGDNRKLRDRLMRLLSYSSTMDNFLEVPPLLSGLQDSSNFAFESIGDKIGPYKLLQKIGEGGMGSVFMADQAEPVKRKVAIKVIKPGMDSVQVLSRFETERQALVMMDHPNIARALDVGTTERGRPYFVMELVKGIPITRYCDEHRLDTDKRLALFVPVCYAVQHAHVKGIIHRDIKPSNVLVADYDNQAVPKVIDFGIAKAIDQQLSQQTLFTQLGQVVGTLEYMSPEQSKVNQLDVDTRSDVYSLGVLLYELLTGSTPIQSDRLRHAAWDELTKMIREEEPPVPSMRISKSETIKDIAASRQTEPGKLSRAVKGELDWIVMRALHKDRARRYQTPNELALDLQRYLNNDPVTACPPSTFYQLSKFARRHRYAMISGILVVCSLALGLVGTVWQARKANRAARIAEEQRDVARGESERARQAERAASQAAEQSRREAEISQAIGKFVNQDLLAFADPDIEPDRNIQLRTLLDRAAKSVSDLQNVPPVEAALRHTLANAYLNLGEYNESNSHAVRALELRRATYGESDPDTLESLLLLGEIQLRSAVFRDAQKTFQEAIEHCSSKLGPHHTLSLRGLHGLGVSWFQLGRLDVARDHLRRLMETQLQVLGADHRDTFETRRELAELLLAKGLYKEAHNEFSTMLSEMNKTLGDSHPLTLKTKGGLASVLMTLGKLGESKKARNEILQTQSKVLGAEHPETLLTASILASVPMMRGRIAEAEQQQRKLLSLAKSRLGDQHLITIQMSTTLADILTDIGSLIESKQLYVQVQNAVATLLDHDNPISLRLKFRHAGLAAFAGQYGEALSRHQEVLDAQRLVLGPSHTDTLLSLAAIAEIQMNQKKYDESEALINELILNAERSLGASHPLVIQSKGRLYTLRSVRGNKADAVGPYRELLASCDRESGRNTPLSIEIATSFGEALGRLGFANESYLTLKERLVDSIDLYGPEHPTTLRIQDSLANALQLLKKLPEAKELNEQVLEIRKRTLGETHPLTLRSLNNIGMCLVEAGNPSEGEKMFRHAFESCKANFGPVFPATLEYGQNLAGTLGLLKKGPESVKLFDEILSSKKRLLGEAHPDLLFTQMGLAGAFSQQLRLVEAERLYASVLEGQRRLIGEAHPQTLQCLEKNLVILGQQERYQEAIQSCKEYLSLAMQKYPGSPNAHRVMHSCIEYHIVQGMTLDAKPFFEQSQEWIDQFGLPPDWMINDLPLLAYSQIQSGELDAAEVSMKRHAKNCESRFGATHPITMQAEVQVMNVLKRRKKDEEASQLLKSLEAKLGAIEAATLESDARLVLVRAMLSGNHEELVSLATKAASQGNWLKATALYSNCVSIASEQVDDHKRVSVEFAEKAIEALEQVYIKGKITKRRELSTLTSTADHEWLRKDPRFPQLIAKIEARLKANALLSSAWSNAMAGNHVIAKSKLEEVANLKVDRDQAKLDGYNSGCVFARCYEAALREVGKQSDLDSANKADEYLQLAIEKLEDCWQNGDFTPSDLLAQLKTDDDLGAIRSTEEFLALMRKMSE